jgi:mRNA-degrading endonuclease RelE of RelBE toxin-antitoxin system
MEVFVTQKAKRDLKSINDAEVSYFKRAVGQLRSGHGLGNSRPVEGFENVFVLKSGNVRVYYILKNDRSNVVIVGVETKKSARKRRKSWVQDRLTQAA